MRAEAQPLKGVLEALREARRTAARTIRSTLGAMVQGVVGEIVIDQWENPLGTRQIKYVPSTNSLVLVSLAINDPYDEEIGVCREMLTEEERQILTPEDHPDNWIRYGARIAHELARREATSAQT